VACRHYGCGTGLPNGVNPWFQRDGLMDQLGPAGCWLPFGTLLAGRPATVAVALCGTVPLTAHYVTTDCVTARLRQNCGRQTGCPLAGVGRYVCMPAHHQ
jgi:hypothetical protein